MNIETVNFIRDIGQTIHTGLLERGVMVDEIAHLYDINNMRTGVIYTGTNSTNYVSTGYDKTLEVKSDYGFIITAFGEILKLNSVWVYAEEYKYKHKVKCHIPITLLLQNKSISCISNDKDITLNTSNGVREPSSNVSTQLYLSTSKLEESEQLWTDDEIEKFNVMFGKDITDMVDAVVNGLKNDMDNLTD